MELCVWEITVHTGPTKMVGILHDSATAGRAKCITVVCGHQNYRGRWARRYRREVYWIGACPS